MTHTRNDDVICTNRTVLKVQYVRIKRSKINQNMNVKSFDIMSKMSMFSLDEISTEVSRLTN